MSDINNIRIGEITPDHILYDNYWADPGVYKFNFNQWEINTNYKNVIDVSNNKLVIKKFKPNIWLMRSPKVNGVFAKDICNYCRGTAANVSGLNVNSNLWSSEYHTISDHGAGNDTPKFRGFCIYPLFSNGLFINQSCYAWDRCWNVSGERNLPGINDYTAFRLDGANGHGSFGLFHDRMDMTLFPEELADIDSWRRGQTVDMYYGIMIATGKVEAFDTTAWDVNSSAGKIVGNKIIYTNRDPQNSDRGIRKSSNIMGFRVKITGLSDGDYVLYGLLNNIKNETATKFTSDGEYDIPVGWGGGTGKYIFSVRGAGSSQVVIEIVNSLCDADGLIDISANPIVIELPISDEIDITNQECWDVRVGDDVLYHKDKTLENCWVEYNLLRSTGLKVRDSSFDKIPEVNWVNPYEFCIDVPVGDFVMKTKKDSSSFSKASRQLIKRDGYYIDISLPNNVSAKLERTFSNIKENKDELYNLKSGRNLIPDLYAIVNIMDASKLIEYELFNLTISNNSKVASKVRVKVLSKINLKSPSNYVVNSHDWSSYGIKYIKLPDIVDFDDSEKMNDLMARTKWQVLARHPEFWDRIKDWYSKNSAWHVLSDGHTFAYSNIDQLDVVMDKVTYPADSWVNNFLSMLYGEDIFNSSNIKSINFVQKNPEYHISSIQRMFRSARDLKTINIQLASPDGFICGANSVVDSLSGASIETYPDRFINWGSYLHPNGLSEANTLCHWMCNTCEKLKTIPAYPDSKNNILRCYNMGEKMFYNCHELTDVGMIIRMALVEPGKSEGMFYNCVKLTGLKLKELNHGDWHFENASAKNGYLPALSAESVKYMIDNLSDLTKSNESSHTQNPSGSFYSWDSEFKNVNSALGNINDYNVFAANEIYLYKRYNDYNAAQVIASTFDKLINMKLIARGLQEGDEIIFGPESQPDLYKINKNNTIQIINKDNTDKYIIKFINKTQPDIRSESKLNVIGGWDSTNPVVNHATLFGPAQWNDKITPEMIESAKAKGWSLNIGGNVK